MQEFIMNFQQKHGKKVPLPKLYGDEDTSDSEGLELADGTTVGKKATGGAGDSGGGGKKKSSTSGSSASTSGGWRQCTRRRQCQYKRWRHRYRCQQQV